MRPRAPRPWPTYLLAALCVGAIVAAVLVVGPASGTATSSGRTIAVGEGVVQSTVSGSGNIQAATQLDLGFKTSGVVTQIYVHQGQHVTEGQLLAELNPDSAEVTLEQARASLQAAEASLVQEEETDGEGSSGAGSSGTDSNHATASAASAGTGSNHATASAASAEDVSYSPPTTSTTAAPTTTPPTTTTPTQTTSTPSTTTPTTTAPARVAPGTTTPARAKAHSRETSSESGGAGTGMGSSSAGGSRESDAGTTAAKATLSTATREANIASARAAVKSDRLTVQSAEEALSDTKLFAPTTGTIVSLSGEVGEAVTASGTTKGSSSSSGSGSSGSGSNSSTASAFGASSAATGASGSGSSGTGSSSSSSFAVLSDLSSMQLVVPLSESEVVNVRDGQPATVTIEALEGLKLAAHVVSVATLPTSSSGVVSYDVTFQLDQLESGLKPGMSATAEVVVKQAEGVNVPTSAIAADTVTVVHDGTQTRRRVVTGLAGNSSTIVLSGLRAGEQIVLPVARSSSTTSSLLSRLGSRTGTLGGGAGGLGGGGGAAFFGGAGGGGFRGG
ncbi:MAG TPA: biotin/lipoyl-binding protein [Solirubrobacteraceae bacterium]|nr:biotin/lipoyl-binding protein [Solirubrobacteraceae bacterium]